MLRGQGELLFHQGFDLVRGTILGQFPFQVGPGLEPENAFENRVGQIIGSAEFAYGHLVMDDQRLDFGERFRPASPQTIRDQRQAQDQGDKEQE